MIDLIANSTLEKEVYYLLKSFFYEKNLTLVKIIFTKGKNSKLELFLDKMNGRVTVEECSLVTREVSSLLEINDPFGEPYRLEVSSAGIDRSLTRLEDFSKYHNFNVKVFKENSTLKGKLVSHSSKTISIQNRHGVSKINLSEIKNVKVDLDKLSFKKLREMESL